MRARLTVAATLFCCTIAGQAQVQQLPPGTASPLEDTKPINVNATALQQAESRMVAQDWTGAVALLTPLLGQQPANGQALYDLGFCEDALNDVDAATSAYTRAIAADPQNVLPGVGLGLLLARNGDKSGAITTLQNALARKGDGSTVTMAAKAQAYRALARLHLATTPDQSRDDLLQALRLSPETPDDIQLGGEIAEALHDDQGAATAYARVAAATPDEVAAVVQYARVLRRTGKADQAAAMLDTALAAHPANAQLLGEKAAALLEQRRIAEALPLLLRLHTAQPENAAATRLLARAYLLQSEFSKADALLQQLAQADPTDGDLSAEWADSLIRQKRNVEAQTLLERALTQRFSTPAAKAKAASELAFAASANHQSEAVVRAISIRSESAPLDATNAFLLATARDSLHQPREAAGAYRQFLQLANGNYPDEEWQAKQRLQTLSRAK